MLCNEDMHRIAVNKIHYQCQIIKYKDSEASSFQSNDSFKVAVRKFILPKLNVKAKASYKLVNLDSIDFEQPPIIRHLDDAMIEQCRHQPLISKHPCHNQRVEHHVKLVTETSASVAGHDSRDAMISQRIRSRKLMKRFETKMQFNG